MGSVKPNAPPAELHGPRSEVRAADAFCGLVSGEHRYDEGMSRARRVPPRKPKYGWEVRIRVPVALRGRLTLVGFMKGVSVGEFARATLDRAVDDVLFKSGSFLWMRPSAPIYRMGAEGYGAPLAATMGGERVLAFARVSGLPRDLGDGHRASGDGYVADLIPDARDGGHLWRRVVVHVENVIPQAPDDERDGIGSL